MKNISKLTGKIWVAEDPKLKVEVGEFLSKNKIPKLPSISCGDWERTTVVFFHGKKGYGAYGQEYTKREFDAGVKCGNEPTLSINDLRDTPIAPLINNNYSIY